jgi:hypothetical protein
LQVARASALIKTNIPALTLQSIVEPTTSKSIMMAQQLVEAQNRQLVTSQSMAEHFT